MFFSVLEQFEITAFSLPNSFFEFMQNARWAFVVDKLTLTLFKVFEKSYLEFFQRHKIYNKIKNLILKLYLYIEGFFYPNMFSTKNYVYSRLLYATLKTSLKIHIKDKIKLFFISAISFVKLQIQETFQKEIKANFGSHFPFYNRLLNFHPYFFISFAVILLHNFNGLLFYGFTNTAFLLQNISFSFQTIAGLTLYGIIFKSYRFYQMFVPSNVPLYLLPFLVIIEIISHLAKIFSLAIRLFANTMSGHILLHILTGFTLNLAKLNYFFIIFPTIIIIAIIFLEFGLSVLQAYVLVTLLAIYFEEHFSFSKKDTLKLMDFILLKGKQIATQFTIFCLRFFFSRRKKTYLHFMWMSAFGYAEGRFKRKRIYKRRRMFFLLNTN